MWKFERFVMRFYQICIILGTILLITKTDIIIINGTLLPLMQPGPTPIHPGPRHLSLTRISLPSPLIHPNRIALDPRTIPRNISLPLILTQLIGLNLLLQSNR